MLCPSPNLLREQNQAAVSTTDFDYDAIGNPTFKGGAGTYAYRLSSDIQFCEIR
jgi:hypothetical protein